MARPMRHPGTSRQRKKDSEPGLAQVHMHDKRFKSLRKAARSVKHFRRQTNNFVDNAVISCVPSVVKSVSHRGHRVAFTPCRPPLCRYIMRQILRRGVPKHDFSQTTFAFPFSNSVRRRMCRPCSCTTTDVGNQANSAQPKSQRDADYWRHRHHHHIQPSACKGTHNFRGRAAIDGSARERRGHSR